LSCSNDAPDDVFRRFDATSLCLSSIATTSVRFAPLRLAARFSMTTLRRRTYASSGGFVSRSVIRSFARRSKSRYRRRARASNSHHSFAFHFIGRVVVLAEKNIKKHQKPTKTNKNQQKS
jgi:hypothetical protein